MVPVNFRNGLNNNEPSLILIPASSSTASSSQCVQYSLSSPQTTFVPQNGYSTQIQQIQLLQPMNNNQYGLQPQLIQIIPLHNNNYSSTQINTSQPSLSSLFSSSQFNLSNLFQHQQLSNNFNLNTDTNNFEITPQHIQFCHTFAVFCPNLFYFSSSALSCDL